MRPTAAPRADHLPIGNFGFDPPASETPRVAMPVSAPAPKTAPQIPDPALLADDTALPLLSADAGDPFAGLLDEADIARPLDPANRAPSKVGAAPAPPTIAQGQTPAPKNASSAVAASEHKRASASPPTPALAQQAIAPVAIPPQSPPPVAAVASAASATTSGFASPSALEAELLTAFLRGLAATHQAPTSLTPELMERIGTMMRSATEGTLQLLLARQEFKREVRAEVTVIASQANNPLKFSPTVDVALAHLLGPGVRGFMPAEEAMRDAYNDLRSHQFGVMVGLRAALAHALSRFEPAVLEKKISAKSKLDALFAANRKAKLWDQFVALYADLATEAEDDFHSLFGKAFLQAYEEQMARLKDAGKN